jgi:hypothetical protein
MRVGKKEKAISSKEDRNPNRSRLEQIARSTSNTPSKKAKVLKFLRDAHAADLDTDPEVGIITNTARDNMDRAADLITKHLAKGKPVRNSGS